jgi:hypothetical protein
VTCHRLGGQGSLFRQGQEVSVTNTSKRNRLQEPSTTSHTVGTSPFPSDGWWGGGYDGRSVRLTPHLHNLPKVTVRGTFQPGHWRGIEMEREREREGGGRISSIYKYRLSENSCSTITSKKSLSFCMKSFSPRLTNAPHVTKQAVVVLTLTIVRATRAVRIYSSVGHVTITSPEAQHDFVHLTPVTSARIHWLHATGSECPNDKGKDVAVPAHGMDIQLNLTVTPVQYEGTR